MNKISGELITELVASTFQKQYHKNQYIIYIINGPRSKLVWIGLKEKKELRAWIMQLYLRVVGKPKTSKCQVHHLFDWPTSLHVPRVRMGQTWYN